MVARLNGDRPGPLAEKLKEFLTERIVSQEQAIKDLAATADVYEAGFQDYDRPIYSALFLGPSGVGKTLSAEILAEFFFGSRTSFTKVACADYQEPHAIAKLIGSPPGYIGFYNPKDPQYKGVEPIFSQYNIDKHDFFYQQTMSEEGCRITQNLKSLKERIEALQRIYEKEYNKRIPRLEELNRKQQQELNKIEEELMKIESEYDNLVQRGDIQPNSQKLQELEKKKNELDELFRQKTASGRTKLMEQRQKDENHLRKIHETELKLKREYGELVHQNKELFTYSPKGIYRSIILFDEIEKANSSLLQLLLEILDKGRLTMSNGDITHLTNSFIILTSNIGSSRISQILTKGGLGFKMSQEKTAADTDQEIVKEAMNEATRVLPPEFRGRLNNTIVFRPLTRENLREILEIQIHELHTLLVKNKFPITLKMAASVREFLIDEANERSDYGARFLKNKLKKHIKEPLSRLKNRKEIKAGDTVYIYLLKKGSEKKICFQRKQN